MRTSRPHPEPRLLIPLDIDAAAAESYSKKVFSRILANWAQDLFSLRAQTQAQAQAQTQAQSKVLPREAQREAA